MKMQKLKSAGNLISAEAAFTCGINAMHAQVNSWYKATTMTLPNLT